MRGSKGWMGALCVAAIVLAWLLGVFALPTDRHQGEIYRIIYLHVPSAFSAFFCALVLLVASIGSFWRRPNANFWGRAACEVGLVWTIATLATGSIWGKPTWGTWWTWDARLTTTFILALLYAGYLFVWVSVSSPNVREKVCAALGIIIFADVPIIYKSVTWWRTLHQPPSILRPEGASMSGVMQAHLLACLALTLIFVIWVIRQRAVNLRMEQDLEYRTIGGLS